jgi:hypothetical protein
MIAIKRECNGPNDIKCKMTSDNSCPPLKPIEKEDKEMNLEVSEFLNHFWTNSDDTKKNNNAGLVFFK